MSANSGKDYQGYLKFYFLQNKCWIRAKTHQKKWLKTLQTPIKLAEMHRVQVDIRIWKSKNSNFCLGHHKQLMFWNENGSSANGDAVQGGINCTSLP